MSTRTKVRIRIVNCNRYVKNCCFTRMNWTASVRSHIVRSFSNALWVQCDTDVYWHSYSIRNSRKQNKKRATKKNEPNRRTLNWPFFIVPSAFLASKLNVLVMRKAIRDLLSNLVNIDGIVNRRRRRRHRQRLNHTVFIVQNRNETKRTGNIQITVTKFPRNSFDRMTSSNRDF